MAFNVFKKIGGFAQRLGKTAIKHIKDPVGTIKKDLNHEQQKIPPFQCPFLRGRDGILHHFQFLWFWRLVRKLFDVAEDEAKHVQLLCHFLPRDLQSLLLSKL